MTTPRNHEQDGVITGGIIAAAGLALLLLPTLVGLDMMAIGYALTLFGLLIFITGLVTLWLYRPRAKALARILSGQGLLAHWVYDPARAEENAAREFAEYRERNRALFIITAILIVVIGAPVLVIPLARDGALDGSDPIALIIVGVYFAIIPLLALVAYVTPRLAYRRALADGAHAYIAEDGVYYNGALHTWRQPLCDLLQVEVEQKGKQAMLRFELRYLTRVGVVQYDRRVTRVPVPEGQEEKAEEIVARLGKQAEEK
jgi:hypothetical protein